MGMLRHDVVCYDYACNYSDRQYFDDWLQHFRDAPGTDTLLHITLLGGATNLRHMRIVLTVNTICLDQECHIVLLAIAYNGADRSPMLTPVVVHTNLQRYPEPPQKAHSLQTVGRISTVNCSPYVSICDTTCCSFDVSVLAMIGIASLLQEDYGRIVN